MLVWILMQFFLLISIAPLHAAEMEERRLLAGLDLFPSFIAADLDIIAKKGADGRLLLLVLCFDGRDECWKRAKARLENIGTIRGIPIRVEVAVEDRLSLYAERSLAGIFLCGGRQHNLQRVMAFARNKAVLVFSPFTGDVEAGVHGGIAVEGQILPVVNLGVSKGSGIRFARFFLRIANHYE